MKNFKNYNEALEYVTEVTGEVIEKEHLTKRFHSKKFEKAVKMLILGNPMLNSALYIDDTMPKELKEEIIDDTVKFVIKEVEKMILYSIENM